MRHIDRCTWEGFSRPDACLYACRLRLVNVYAGAAKLGRGRPFAKSGGTGRDQGAESASSERTREGPVFYKSRDEEVRPMTPEPRSKLQGSCTASTGSLVTAAASR